MAADRDDITVLLARAFDQAWNGYYRLGRLVTISEDVARRALATVLIRLEREGMREEDALAQCGIKHLISITPKPWAQVRVENAGAKFVRPWRIRISGLSPRSD